VDREVGGRDAVKRHLALGVVLYRFPSRP
jgi:hypothetical protein